MAKIDSKQLELLVNKELNRILKEEDEFNSDGTIDTVNMFIDDEKKDLTNTINNDNKVMSALRNPDERNLKQKQININKAKLKNLDKIKSDIDSQKSKQEKEQSKDTKSTKSTESTQTTMKSKSQIGTGIGSGSGALTEQPITPTKAHMAAPVNTPVAKPKKKVVYSVAFDVKSKQPFTVKFSERGFSINGTRLSFENLESAISKNFFIILDAGKGLVLDTVRMQKILKYKDRFH